MKYSLKNNPKIAKEWHPTKNERLTPKDLTLGSNKKVWWLCAKGHEWQAKVNDRNYRQTGCPYCSGRRACDDNSLQTLKPALARGWHLARNGSLTPSDVTPGSSKKAWWICSKGHEWSAAVSKRSRGWQCPYCLGRAVSNDNCLQAVNPDLAKQWHPVKNGSLTPRDVTPNSDKKAWWTCERGHEWQAAVSNRNRGRGCPYCAGRAVWEDNCLKTVNPLLAVEWHTEKNGNMTSREVTPGSRKRVWWRCKNDHEWQAQINSRNKGYGKCPHCRGKREL